MGLGNAQRTMLSGTAISILLIALTPLLGGILALLLLFQMVRGWLEGVIQPLVLSVQARAAGRHQQGAVVGLRQTGQRFTSIVVPPIMGTIADRFGVSASFLLIGGFMLRVRHRGRSVTTTNGTVHGRHRVTAPETFRG
jgi:sugar phosphate permease